MTESWLRRCPEGHCIERVNKETYHCDSCAKTYEGEPHDPREVDSFPVDSDKAVERVEPIDVLKEIVRQTEPDERGATKTKRIDIGRPAQVSYAVSQLRKDGLIEAIGGGSGGHFWRPTEAGRQKVFEAERGKALNSRGPRFDRARGQVHPIGYAALIIEMLFFAGFLFWVAVML